MMKVYMMMDQINRGCHNHNLSSNNTDLHLCSLFTVELCTDIDFYS